MFLKIDNGKFEFKNVFSLKSWKVLSHVVANVKNFRLNQFTEVIIFKKNSRFEVPRNHRK